MKCGVSTRSVTGVLCVVLAILGPGATRPPSSSSPTLSSSSSSAAAAASSAPIPSADCLNASSTTSDELGHQASSKDSNNAADDEGGLNAGFKLSDFLNVSGAGAGVPESTLPYPELRSAAGSGSRSGSGSATHSRAGSLNRAADRDLSDADESGYFDYYYEEPEESFSPSGQQPPRGESQTPGSGEHRHQPPPGLSRVAKLKLLKVPRRQPPEYMLELYDRFSKATSPVTRRTPEENADGAEKSSLGADIVRSFPNINKEDVADTDDSDVTDEDDDNANDTTQQLPGRETRHHTLVFNITSLLAGEEVSHAELRLYTLVEQDRNTFVGDNREVRVFEGLGRAARPGRPPVASRFLYGRSGGWEAFDVTSVVQAWVRKGPKPSLDDRVHVLEVKIDSVFHEPRGKSGAGRAGLAMDIDVDPEHNEGPLLVVFSRATSRQLDRQRELQEMISHELPYAEEEDADLDPESDDDSSSDSSEADAGDSGSLVSRRREGVSSTTTSNGNGQSVVFRSKRRASAVSRRRAGELFGLPAVSARAEPDAAAEGAPLRRVRREKRRRNGCRRKTMYVDFQDINWHQWIIAPQGYMAFECEGRCFIPIGNHLSPTNHAIIQTLMHAVQPKRASRACCVPTKLEPISILYLDENNVITYKYNYDDMVVAECGCR